MIERNQSTDEIKSLMDSCGPDEVCMMFGPLGVHKLPRAVWGHMYLDACVEATRRAMDDAGAKYTIERTENGGWRIDSPGTTGLYVDGESLYLLDMEESSITARARAANGKEGTGVVYLVPPGRTN